MIDLLAVAGTTAGDRVLTAVVALAVFAAVFVGVLAWWRPAGAMIRRQERRYEEVLRGKLLMDVNPRTVTVLSLMSIGLFALIAYGLVGHPVMVVVGGVFGGVLPSLVLRFLKRRRLYKLEEQLVNGVTTLSSGVRAGLNLIQAMDLLAKNGVRPISEEFAHLIREYEHGIPIERAMAAACDRIGSGNYRLLFTALLTHRERGGDLGETLDRIAESLREINRLEKRIETLTAPGRAAAKWMGAMPAVILLILYMIFPTAVAMLFTENAGKIILAIIVLLNVVGFIWVRRIVSIDV